MFISCLICNSTLFGYMSRVAGKFKLPAFRETQPRTHGVLRAPVGIQVLGRPDATQFPSIRKRGFFLVKLTILLIIGRETNKKLIRCNFLLWATVKVGKCVRPEFAPSDPNPTPAHNRYPSLHTSYTDNRFPLHDLDLSRQIYLLGRFLCGSIFELQILTRSHFQM